MNVVLTSIDMVIRAAKSALSKGQPITHAVTASRWMPVALVSQRKTPVTREHQET